MATDNLPDPPSGSIAALLEAGADLVGMKQYDTVHALIQHIIAMQPDAAAWAGVSSLYLGMAEAHEALAAAQKATALDPQNAAAWRCTALALWHLHRAKEALEALATGLRIAPDDPELWRVQASIYYVSRHYAAALAAVDHALAAAPDAPYLRHFRMAIIYQMDHKALPPKAIVDELYIEPMIPWATIWGGLPDAERRAPKPGGLRGLLSEIRDFWRVRRFTRSIRARQRHQKRRPLPHHAGHR
jgi:tetratricopeptide (TPR) repeat protein